LKRGRAYRGRFPIGGAGESHKENTSMSGKISEELRLHESVRKI
jgi:hypothetical protein